MGNAAAPKITTRSFVFQHADSGNCQKPHPKRVCGRPVIIKNRANDEPVSFQCRSALLVSPAIGWRIAATTGPAASFIRSTASVRSTLPAA
jgi:hypothetical protein